MQVLPTLAVAVGLEEAIVVQQLHWYFRNPKNGREINGQRWIFNTYASWKKIFPWWSEITIKRIFIRLEGMHIVESCQPEGGISRRKYYRLNYGMVNLMRKGKLSLPSDQIDTIDGSNWTVPLTETTCIESKESKETDHGSVDSFPSTWKPRSGTKDEKLQRIRMPKSYPSELEFDSFLDSDDLGSVIEYRSDLYSELCTNKWHQWKEWLGKWVRIRDWKAYLSALDSKIAPS